MNTIWKNTLLIALLSCSLALTGYAQGHGSGRHGGSHEPPTQEQVEERALKMAELLKLNKQTSSEFVALALEQHQQMSELREAQQEERQANREQMRTLREEHEAKLRDLLTEEQFDQLRKERHYRRKGH